MFSSMLSLLGSLRGGSSFITNSLRFRSSASAYLSRTFGVATNANIWTWSGWIKRGSLGGTYGILGYTVGSSDADNLAVRFVSDNFSMVGGTTSWRVTSRVFRDSAAWLHCVIAVDTTQTTPANRIKIYFNGVEETAFSTNNNPNQNTTIGVNRSGITDIGRYSTQYFDGYLTEVNFIDGQALTPASFGAIDLSTGVWAPSRYSGTYGTNGFYLKFANTSSVAALGNDSSGNNNTWTVNNVSLTAGATYDSMIDVPVNYSDGGNGRGNYAVLNPLDFDGGQNTITDGNLNVVTSNSVISAANSSVSVSSGKWYWEITQGAITVGSPWIGVSKSPLGTISTNGFAQSVNGYAYNGTSGQKGNNNTFTAYGATYTSGDIIGVALDLDAGTLVFYKNNISQGTAFTGLSGEFRATIGDGGGANTISAIANFGQRPFAYTPPAGFRALNTNNLPTPSIVNGANFMAATTYTGNAAARSLSNAVNSVSFQPDLVWIKSRTPGATNHALFDSVRGTTKYLSSNTTTGETTLAQSLTAFGADGFSLGTDTALVNANANSYVAWQWKESVAAGLDVVSWNSNGNNNVIINHTLGVAPSMIIAKYNSGAGASPNWYVYHKSLTSGNIVALNTTGAAFSSPSIFSSVGSSSFTSNMNAATDTFVAYCFAEIVGFSRFGSYTGNGSTDGPFVFCGFRPRFVLIKSVASSVYFWRIFDTSRNSFNLSDLEIYPNSPIVEQNVNGKIDIISNGFKIRTGTGSGINDAEQYIFAAFAEVPSKYALAR